MLLEKEKCDLAKKFWLINSNFFSAPTTAAPTTAAPTTADPTTAALTTATFKDGDCYQDCSPRLLPHLTKNYKMTQEICKSFCFKENNYIFAGVEFSHECWCGNDEPPAAKLRPLSECNTKCPGNSAEKCGGGCRINIFQNLGNFLLVSINIH